MKRIIIFLILFGSCDRGEKGIVSEPRPVITEVITLESDYINQVYYDLYTTSVVSSNVKFDWDIGFSCNALDSRLILNSSNGGAVCKFYNMNFNEEPELNNVVWQWDTPNGDMDSTAFGNLDTNILYIIDRGYDLNGNNIGYKKIRLLEFDNLGYHLRIANLDNTEDTLIYIVKNSNKQFVSFSFNDYSIDLMEPEKTNWDLLFTQYTEIFTDPAMAYIVTGVLINQNHVQVALDTINTFNDIDYSMVNQYTFSSARNYIGYQWKYYSFSSASYTILDHYNFIIKDDKDRYFKLHFIDFYNNMGEKGFPTFEIQELL